MKNSFVFLVVILGIAALSIPDGSIYICDRYNFRVQKFNPDHSFETGWKTSGSGDDSKHYVLEIAVAKDGRVYVTDHYQHVIEVYQNEDSL